MTFYSKSAEQFKPGNLKTQIVKAQKEIQTQILEKRVILKNLILYYGENYLKLPETQNWEKYNWHPTTSAANLLIMSKMDMKIYSFAKNYGIKLYWVHKDIYPMNWAVGFDKVIVGSIVKDPIALWGELCQE